jgi:hypothetical protein
VTEEAILDYLYQHPDGGIGTSDLAKILKPEQDTTERQLQAFEEVKYGIETLFEAGLITWKKKIRESGLLQHKQLGLTKKGEAEAIRQARQEKVNVPALMGVLEAIRDRQG